MPNLINNLVLPLIVALTSYAFEKLLDEWLGNRKHKRHKKKHRRH